MTVRAAHPTLVRALRCVDSVENRSRLMVAADFVERSGLERTDFIAALKLLDTILDDPVVSNADIKGMLNRVDAWQHESPFGADAKAARQHLEAARNAIAAWIKDP